MRTFKKVFESVGAPALRNTLDGFNGTIFAYGQTGSGKSHCMAGTQAEPGPCGVRSPLPRGNVPETLRQTS